MLAAQLIGTRSGERRGGTAPGRRAARILRRSAALAAVLMLSMASGALAQTAERQVGETQVFTTLPYGKTWHQGVFTCTSRANGLTCRNPTGHGLFISRESWRVW